MMQNKTTYLSLVLLMLLSCKTSNILFPPLTISEHQLIDFCELPKHANELTYTRAIYSGMEEYWSLKSTDDKCEALKTELEIPENVIIEVKFKKLLGQVHKSYWDRHLIIDAIGIFEIGDKNGYGHLGSNNSKFTVNKIINIQLVRKQN